MGISRRILLLAGGLAMAAGTMPERLFFSVFAVPSCMGAEPAAIVAEPAVGGWVKSASNPVLSLGTGDDFDRENIFAPAIVKDAGRYFLFYAGGPAGPRTKEDYVRYQLGLALSDDGERFTKTGRPLLPLGERDDFHCTPALLREPSGELHKRDGLWHLIFCGNRADDVEHATSRDGLAWEKDPRNPIYRRAYAPALVQVEDELRMYFVHKPQRRPGGSTSWEIHLATGPDLYSLRPHPANPMLRVSQAWEKSHLFYPYVLREGQTWIMFYASYWTGHPSAGTATAIGMATSRDGLEWTKHAANPVLKPAPGSPYEAIYNSSQSVIRDGERYRLFYGARVNMVHKYFAIGAATHPVPLFNERTQK